MSASPTWSSRCSVTRSAITSRPSALMSTAIWNDCGHVIAPRLADYGLATQISLTSVVLVTELEAAGIEVTVLDDDDLHGQYGGWLRKNLSDYDVVAVSTTYTVQTADRGAAAGADPRDRRREAAAARRPGAVGVVAPRGRHRVAGRAAPRRRRVVLRRVRGRAGGAGLPHGPPRPAGGDAEHGLPGERQVRGRGRPAVGRGQRGGHPGLVVAAPARLQRLADRAAGAADGGVHRGGPRLLVPLQVLQLPALLVLPAEDAGAGGGRAEEHPRRGLPHRRVHRGGVPQPAPPVAPGVRGHPPRRSCRSTSGRTPGWTWSATTPGSRT